MQAFLISLSTVAIAECGDRTQLLALLLAARYRRPWPILAGLLCATLACNALAAVIGARLSGLLTPRLLDALVGLSMIGMGIWTLRPDSLQEERLGSARRGAFMATLLAFGVAETGDKTQIATMALAAAWSNIPSVIAGSTLGMMLANAPAVLLGHAFASRLPLRLINLAASLLFIALGAYFLWRAWRLH